MYNYMLNFCPKSYLKMKNVKECSESFIGLKFNTVMNSFLAIAMKKSKQLLCNLISRNKLKSHHTQF